MRVKNYIAHTSVDIGLTSLMPGGGMKKVSFLKMFGSVPIVEIKKIRLQKLSSTGETSFMTIFEKNITVRSPVGQQL